MHFFHLNDPNVRGILVKKSIMHTLFFCQFSDIKNGVRFKQPSVLGQLVTSELAELAVLRKANLIFQ